jgi:hypothetical protein
MNDRDYHRKDDGAGRTEEMKAARINIQPLPFQLSTYIYIRSYDGDVGDRPIPGDICYWLSPDISFYRIQNQPLSLSEMRIGNDYVVEVKVINRSLMMSRAVIVELYLANPFIGQYPFHPIWNSPQGAKYIGTNIFPMGGHSQNSTTFYYAPTPDTIGHRCLFARAFSLPTCDYSSDWQSFNPVTDRHVAQRNLDIVKQLVIWPFDIFAFSKGKRMEYELTLKVSDKNIKKLDIPILKKFNLLTKQVNTKLFALAHLGAIPLGIENEHVKPEDIDKIRPEMPHTEKMIGNFQEGMAIFSSETGADKMQITIPDLGLKPGEAVPMELEAKDKKTGELIGGIALIITG